MSTNHTEHYNLSQWERTDKVLMEDFNEDNAKIDAALAGKAAQSALDALAQTVGGHASVLAGKGNCRVETFTYTGKHSEFVNGASNTIRFSIRPVFVLIFGNNNSIMLAGQSSLFIGRYDGLNDTTVIPITTSWSGGSLSLTYPVPEGRMDALGATYQVIAWMSLS